MHWMILLAFRVKWQWKRWGGGMHQCSGLCFWKYFVYRPVGAIVRGIMGMQVDASQGSENAPSNTACLSVVLSSANCFPARGWLCASPHLSARVCVCVYMPLERDESGNKERRKTLKLGGNWLFPCCILKLGEFWEVNMRLFLCFGCSCFKLLAIKEYLLLQCSGKYLPS